jgi:hypothetical protein
MSLSRREAEEAEARKRFVVVTAVRFGGVALTMVGFAIVRGVIDAPYAIGAVLAVVGVIDIFVAPWLLARGWKARDRDRLK